LADLTFDNSADVLIVLDELHTDDVFGHGQLVVGELRAQLGEMDAAESLPVRLFHLQELTSQPWPIKLRPWGTLYSLGERDSWSEIAFRWDETESLAIDSALRLVNWFSYVNAIRGGDSEPWYWGLMIDSTMPNIHLSALTRLEEEPLDDGTLAMGNWERTVRSDLSFGQTTLERYQGKMSIDPLTGALAHETVQFQISNLGWLQQCFQGVIDIHYSWEWIGDPPVRGE
jgi:hypothetical protein